MIIAAWTGATLIAPGLKPGRKLTIGAGSVAMAVVALTVFVALNPFMTARPRGRLSEEARELAEKNVWQRFRLPGHASLQSIAETARELSRTMLFSPSPKRPRSWSSRASAASARSVRLKIIQRYALTYARTGVHFSGHRWSFSGWS